MGLVSFNAARLSVIVGLLSVSSSVLAEVTTPFVALVQKNWSAWDADQNGTLTEGEINASLKDATLTGDDAAALAAIKLVHRANKADLPPLTLNYFNEYAVRIRPKLKGPQEESRAADAGTVDVNGESIAIEGKLFNFDRTFTASKNRIARGGDAVQWRESDFNRDNVSQGPLGDCFFVASIGSAVTHRPELINQLIQQLPDGRFRATFPGAEPFTFEPLTDAQRALGSTTRGDGAWLAVLEQAYGKHRSRLRGGSLDVEGTDILRRGGDSAVTLQALTGNQTNRISFPRSLSGRIEKQEEMLRKLRPALISALRENRIITCGIVPVRPNKVNENDAQAVAKEAARMKDVPTRPKGIQINHVYAVINYDPATDVVEIWNPHGQTFDPNGEPGPVNGYVTRNGRFKLPLAEAYGFYTSFTFETSTPKPAGKDQTANTENRN